VSASQDQFFDAVVARQIPRVRVAAIVVADGSVLVQQPADDPTGCFAFIGGEYEVGDTFESRLRREVEEETTARIVSAEYLFCVENHFRYKDRVIQQAEHYFRVELDRRDVESREAHLRQVWIPLAELTTVDLRPRVVRDATADGSWLQRRHMVQAAD
jgi:ADP-ribose pyrophosphatase YjhB (NUDIX family)